MSTPYFSTTERCEALIAACKAREGTPFREGMAAPGLGYDCAPFVRDVFAAAGVDTSPFDTCPRVSLHYGRFHNKSIFVSWLHDIGGARLPCVMPDEQFMCGDILIIRDPQCASGHHMAVCESPAWAWHVPFGGCVTSFSIGMIRNKRRNLIQIAHRLMEQPADV